jgi:hypothetical protein
VGSFEKNSAEKHCAEHPCRRWGDLFVTRALRNHNVWLTLTYLGLILLMARVYA